MIVRLPGGCKEATRWCRAARSIGRGRGRKTLKWTRSQLSGESTGGDELAGQKEKNCPEDYTWTSCFCLAAASSPSLASSLPPAAHCCYSPRPHRSLEPNLHRQPAIGPDSNPNRIAHSTLVLQVRASQRDETKSQQAREKSMSRISISRRPIARSWSLVLAPAFVCLCL